MNRRARRRGPVPAPPPRDVLPPRELLRTLRAFRSGDFGASVPAVYTGVAGEIADELNQVIELSRALSEELSRVSKVVGKEGKVGVRASLGDLGGSWSSSVSSVNELIEDLVRPTTEVGRVIGAFAAGDLSQTMPLEFDGRPLRGEFLRTAKTVNGMLEQLGSFASEVTRVAREVGTEGKLGGQARVRGAAGTWKDLTDSVNLMARNLTGQVRNIAGVTTAVARGDLTKKITVDVKGEILELKNTINTMVDQLNSFASEVTRVAREVGTEGKLGGQAEVPDVSGTWKDLTDSVNFMAGNLTTQVRNIAEVTTAVARGDLSRKIAVDVKGEILELKNTINTMVDQLNSFASEVTRVAREVGTEGELGGQAEVPGAAGTWRDLTDSVNQLAANLTTQVRAIGDVATAVTKGDLNRYVTVEASGEVATLKDNINEMIRNLKETTQKTTEQDWLKTNLARFTRMLQGQRDLVAVARQTLSELAPLVSAQHGVVYLTEMDGHGEVRLKLLASYGCADSARPALSLGEGLIGQVALEKRTLVVDPVPEGYATVRSGLGEAPPRSLTVLPVLFEGRVNAVVELGSFRSFSDIHQVFLAQLTESIGIVINTISASMRTEALLQQSQSLTRELQIQQEELRQTNDRLELQAATLRESEERLKQQQEALQVTNEQLEDKAELLELKNREVELAKAEIEEKAEQLALASRYKSEFLANMSHELRTPLNSLLILSTMLAENAEGTLSAKQVEFARTICASGTDLLELINDILDLSKVESGTVAIRPGEVVLAELKEHVEKNFRHVAEQRALEFQVELGAGLPALMTTDEQRLQQVLKNLLSNAFKFTERGSVRLVVGAQSSGWTPGHETLDAADTVIAFAVSDTGIGIPESKQRIIFEAFQQSDGTTVRRYGGTGLGLSISREIARLLGGEIRVSSKPEVGSTFTFYLPRLYSTPPAVVRQERTRARSPAVFSAEAVRLPASRLDDLRSLSPGDPAVLIVDDDVEIAHLALDAAHRHGSKAVVASDCSAALALLGKVNLSAVVLGFPDSDAWAVLDRLKHDAELRRVPVAVFAGEDARARALALGAACFSAKPVDGSRVEDAVARMLELSARTPKRLLLLGGDSGWGGHLRELLGGQDVEVEVAEGGELADGRDPECRVVRVQGEVAEVLEGLSNGGAARGVPTILHVDRTPSEGERQLLRRMALPFGVRFASSEAALLGLSCIFLHRPEVTLNPLQRTLLESSRRLVEELDGAEVLVVDDDVRNIFAVTSVLERHRARVVYADNGRDGLALLDEHPEVRAVLMDIMMPEMDGYDVIRRIRQHAAHGALPVIALTAKAMRADREKCLQAGASDYIAKPVNLEHLLSTLRVWLSQ
ncbi:MAG: response regulator [Myxococcales bacterium]|nr:response regulator [Myxococcales bacterium]